ncbi:MAG TPA: CDGSH iron-sulfur domain-containing protein [Microlunatus sp.]
MIDSLWVEACETCYHCIGPSMIQLISSPDGPLLIRGAERLVDEDGEDHPVRRPVVALCRCGTSTHPPWCDGMHKLLQRRDRKDV